MAVRDVMMSEEKKDIRRKMLDLRDRELAEHCTETGEKYCEAANRAILKRLVGDETFMAADLVMPYVSYRNEVDTLELLRYLETGTKAIAVPKVYRDGRMEFYMVGGLSDLKSGYHGILEPDPEACQLFAPETAADSDIKNVLILMPAVALDEDKHRIGYGGGYYDRYLERIRRSGLQVTVMALAFEAQILPQIPTEATDLCPDLILTEQRRL